MRKLTVFLISAFLVLGAGNARAALLGLDLLYPDIFSDTTGVYTYDAATDLIQFDATALTITFLDSTNTPVLYGISGGSYNADFYVNSSGSLTGGVAGDDIVISGTFTDTNGIIGAAGTSYSGNLVTGEVVKFGWMDLPGTYATFDYLFVATGGLLQDFYCEANPWCYGGDFASIEGSNFADDWSVNHAGSKVKHDTAPVPEPATLLLLGSGLAGFALMRRRFIG